MSESEENSEEFELAKDLHLMPKNSKKYHKYQVMKQNPEGNFVIAAENITGKTKRKKKDKKRELSK